MKDVMIYSTPTCPYCIKAKRFLEEAGVEYEEKDVSSDEGAADEAIKKSGQMGVPVLDIEGEIIVGFDKGAISAALGL
jgi:glutaredoxin-like YruB-family protein